MSATDKQQETFIKYIVRTREFGAVEVLANEMINTLRDRVETVPLEEVNILRGRIRGIRDFINTLKHYTMEGGEKE